MNKKSGEIILAFIVGICVTGIGMAIVTHRTNAIKAGQGEVAVDLLSLRGSRQVVDEHPNQTIMAVVAGVLAGAEADRIKIKGYGK
jgi:hypothetical protein